MDPVEIHERIIIGDPEALACFQTETRGAIEGYVRRRGLPLEVAEEIWNDAFLEAVRKAPELERDGESLRKYAFGVAAHRIADRRRRGEVVASQLDEAVTDSPAPTGPLPVDERRVAALQDCLARTRDRYRLVLEMRNDGFEVDEIGRVLGIGAGSVYKVIERARAWMRACISGRLSA